MLAREALMPGRSSGGPTWQAEILIMLLIAGCGRAETDRVPILA
jgi:hypothetical protein